MTFYPQLLPEAGDDFGYFRIDWSRDEALNGIETLFSATGDTASIAEALTAALQVTYTDDMRHRIVIYGSYVIESGIMSVVDQLVSQPKCCPGDPKPPYCGPGTGQMCQ